MEKNASTQELWRGKFNTSYSVVLYPHNYLIIAKHMNRTTLIIFNILTAVITV